MTNIKKTCIGKQILSRYSYNHYNLHINYRNKHYIINGKSAFIAFTVANDCSAYNNLYYICFLFNHPNLKYTTIMTCPIMCIVTFIFNAPFLPVSLSLNSIA